MALNVKTRHHPTSLSTSVDLLEKKCEELQELADNLRLSLRPKDTQDTSSADQEEQDSDQQNFLDGPDHADHSDFIGFEASLPSAKGWQSMESPFGTDLVRLRSSLSRLKCQLSREQEQKEGLQSELDDLIQENMRLQEQVLASQEREHQCLNLQMEMDLLEDDDRHLCPSCKVLSKLDRCEEPEEELAELDHFSMVQLEDGVVVYGDHDSLPDIELDAQYRLLIDKYEALLDARCRSLDLNEPAGGTAAGSPAPWASRGRAKPSLDHGEKKARDYPSLSNASDAESAESGETSLSSGFSEGTTAERCFSDQAVQTSEPASSAEARRQLALDLAAAGGIDPLGTHFSRSPPEYKKLFAEIFAVLKQTVTDATGVESASGEALLASPRKSNQASSRGSSPGKRMLKTNLDISKLCDVDKQVPPRAEETKVQLPGSLTYAEAVRKGRVVRRVPARACYDQQRVPAKGSGDQRKIRAKGSGEQRKVPTK
ncbi:conserved hypothetical protein [Ixodes scapularis]|uniref:Cerebellar degeneration-related protein 2-like n=1 Tax=Ixodes scapularis TaxID=6945 RepID=B7PAG3_IXOSC|nr:conserved hypothetical protein [Ixodes scapularis]|eukprot:XP_002406838.1 conserved hypothetical protein [Ixodes scapularis]